MNWGAAPRPESDGPLITGFPNKLRGCLSRIKMQSAERRPGDAAVQTFQIFHQPHGINFKLETET